MPTEFDISNFQICTLDGTPVNLASFEHVFTSHDSDLDLEDNKAISLSNSMECTFSGEVQNVYSFNKMMRKIACGWTSRGPVREKLLKRQICKQTGLLKWRSVYGLKE